MQDQNYWQFRPHPLNLRLKVIETHVSEVLSILEEPSDVELAYFNFSEGQLVCLFHFKSLLDFVLACHRGFTHESHLFLAHVQLHVSNVLARHRLHTYAIE